VTRKPTGLIVIPARGGSKGIRNKNIINVNNRPLIFYTIKPALRLKSAGVIDDVVVSTDSARIIDIARRLGAHVPFTRPKSIAGDSAKSVDLVLHAIEYFETTGISYDYVVLLQPTSPLRQYQDIKDAITLYLRNTHDSLISAYRENSINETKLYYRRGDLGIPLLPTHNEGRRRQDLQSVFVRNGAIFITSTTYLKKQMRIVSDSPLIFEMPQERSLEVDTQGDLTELRRMSRRTRG
jgi:CMP-N,N'-diacetyllegionaminic acid synthase